MSNATHDIKSEEKLYFKVFFGLLILTVITVALKYFHVGIALAVFLALLVATTKASLVASFFMHLAHERRVIYVVLGLTAVFFVSMLFLIIVGQYSTPEGTENLNFKYKTETVQHHAESSAETHSKTEAHH